MKKFYIKTYGCQMNEYDAEYISSIFYNMGFCETGTIVEADYIVINTCSVREKPQSKVYSELGRLSLLVNKKPDLKIGICGCVAQQDGLDIFKKFETVKFIVGTDALSNLSTILENVEAGIRVIDIEFTGKDFIFTNYNKRKKRTAYVGIMKGCDNFCSYCIVPVVRGRERSRPLKEIIDEVKKLIDYGTKEITFLGQNVNSYGKSLDENINFPKFLNIVSRINGLERIRFTTSHPKDLTEELIYECASNKKICKHVHMPLQSGSDRILHLMNRGYSVSEYMAKLEKLRKIIPDIGVTSDFIVGFPTESDEDFNSTLKVLSDVQYNTIFAFKYSKRPLTKAFELSDNIGSFVKKERLDKVLKVQAEITYNVNRIYEGKMVEVLVEGISKRDNKVYTGRNSQNIVVNFTSRDHIGVGDIVNVKIAEGKKNSLFGDRVLNKFIGGENVS